MSNLSGAAARTGNLRKKEDYKEHVYKRRMMHLKKSQTITK